MRRWTTWWLERQRRKAYDALLEGAITGEQYAIWVQRAEVAAQSKASDPLRGLQLKTL